MTRWSAAVASSFCSLAESTLNILDVIVLLRHLFLGEPSNLPCEGGTVASFGNRALLDANGDGLVDTSDSVYTLLFLFDLGPDHQLGRHCARIVGCPEVCSTL